MILENPEYLFLLLIILAIYMWNKNRNNTVSIQYPNISGLINLYDPKSRWLSKVVKSLKYIVLAIIVMALAKPQLIDYKSRSYTKGVDILLLLDISVSMNAEDFKPNRINIAKSTISKFINKRKTDRIGLVVFGGEATTISPLTTDYNLLVEQLNATAVGDAGNGTAIGLAITTGLNRLKSKTTKNKVMVLLTDGENNAGNITPLQAAKIAKEMGIKIYAIGIGNDAGAYIPIYDPKYGKRYIRDAATGARVKTKLDNIALKEVAAVTNGKFFAATNNQGLQTIYEEINTLEKSKVKLNQHQNVIELFPVLLWISLILLIFENLITNILLVAIP